MGQIDHTTVNSPDEGFVIGYLTDRGDGQSFILQSDDRLARRFCEWANAQPVTFRLAWLPVVRITDEERAAYSDSDTEDDYSPVETTEQQFATSLIEEVRAHWIEPTADPMFPDWLTDLAADRYTPD